VFEHESLPLVDGVEADGVLGVDAVKATMSYCAGVDMFSYPSQLVS
jgi:hypothetical protein